MDVRSLITNYLDDARMMQVATVREGRPWCCTVWFAYDDDLHIYWFSSITRRHSHEVADDPHVAGAIALPQTPEDPARGVQFEGRASRLDAQGDVDQAKSLYIGRIFTAEKVNEMMSHAERPHVFYRIDVETFVLFDAINFPEQPRQELHL